MNPTEQANRPIHYLVIVLAVIICVIGLFTRFADFKEATAIANTIFIIGVAVALRAVYGILR